MDDPREILNFDGTDFNDLMFSNTCPSGKCRFKVRTMMGDQYGDLYKCQFAQMKEIRLKNKLNLGKKSQT